MAITSRITPKVPVMVPVKYTIAKATAREILIALSIEPTFVFIFSILDLM
jgi:hypothetical protein